MLMEKLRFVVMALVAAAAAGAVALGYRSGAAEPPAPAAVVPPAAPPRAAVKEEGMATASSTNFEVTAPTRRLAVLFAEAAEHHRKELAILWLGKELPAWPERCPIKVQVTMDGAGGATTFAYDGGKVESRSMHLEGSLDRLLTSVLPHEVTHTIFADYFGRPVVRWADEGGAVLSEDEEERQRHEKLARQIVDTPGRALALRRLLALKDFPDDVMRLFAEGYSVTRFLVEKKDRKTFLAFVKRGMSDGWDKAVKEYYDFRDVEALEDAWLAELRRQAKTEPKPLPPPPARIADGGAGGLTVPPGVPPVTGVAVMDKKGRIALLELVTVYVPVSRPVKREGKDDADMVTSYAHVAQPMTRLLDPAETPVYGTEGKRIDPKKLPELLRTETAVLVSRDGKMVDPFHLRLIKEGTLIVVPPPATAAAPVPAPGVVPGAVTDRRAHPSPPRSIHAASQAVASVESPGGGPVMSASTSVPPAAACEPARGPSRLGPSGSAMPGGRFAGGCPIANSL
jgi:hypothetical protein